MHRCLASVLAIAVLVPALAAAQPRRISASARRELDRGLALFQARDYAGAILAFDLGYAIDPHPDFLYAKAQAQRIGGDCRGALASYDAFLETRPPEKEASRAQINMARCAELLAASAPRVEPPPAAAAPSPAPEPEPEPVSAPETQPAPEPRPARRDAAPTTARAWWKDRPGLALAVTGTAALTTGAVFAWRARSAAEAAGGAGDVTAWYELESAHHRDRTVAGIAAGLGAALIATAGVRLVWASRTSGDRAVTAAATAAPGGAALWLGGAW